MPLRVLLIGVLAQAFCTRAQAMHPKDCNDWLVLYGIQEVIANLRQLAGQESVSPKAVANQANELQKIATNISAQLDQDPAPETTFTPTESEEPTGSFTLIWNFGPWQAAYDAIGKERLFDLREKLEQDFLGDNIDALMIDVLLNVDLNLPNGFFRNWAKEQGAGSYEAARLLTFFRHMTSKSSYLRQVEVEHLLASMNFSAELAGQYLSTMQTIDRVASSSPIIAAMISEIAIRYSLTENMVIRGLQSEAAAGGFAPGATFASLLDRYLDHLSSVSLIRSVSDLNTFLGE